MSESLKKSSLIQAEPQSYPETVYGDDIRALVLAHVLNNKMSNVEADIQIKGAYVYYYRKMEGLRKILIGLIVLLFILQKPNWCQKMGDDISEDCSIDSQGGTYDLAINTFIDNKLSFILSFGLMYFLIILQILKIQTSEKVVPDEKWKLIFQVCCFTISLVLCILEAFGTIPRTDFSSIFRILFVIVYFKSIFRAFNKIFRMLVNAYSILLMFVVNLLVFSLLARIIFEGVPVGADSILQGYTFNSFFGSLDSMFKILFFENFPDMLLDVHVISPFYTLFFVVYILITAILILALVTGVFYFHFKSIYTDNLNKVAFKYKDFVSKTEHAMKSKFLKPQIVEMLTKRFEHNLRFPEKREEVSRSSEVRNSYKAKMRRAVSKIKYMNTFNKPTGDTNLKAKYMFVSQSFFYSVVSFILAAYLCFMPAIVIDSEKITSFLGYLQQSEFIAVIFLTDFMLCYKFHSKVSNFWTYGAIAEISSNIGIIATAHILYLIPSDFRENVIISSKLVYFTWAAFCFLKFFKIQKLLMKAINYKIIIKTILHIFPLLMDLLSCYFVLILFYSTVAFTVFGGIMNSNFGAYYSQVTGGDWTDQYNFNDIFNSLLSFMIINISTSFSSVTQPALVAFTTISNNSFAFFSITIFFYSFVFISELIVINIIIGFIIDFLSIYEDNNIDLRTMEEKIQNKQDFVDVIIDNKDFSIHESEDEEEFEIPTSERNGKDATRQARSAHQHKNYELDPSAILSNDFDSDHSEHNPDD